MRKIWKILKYPVIILVAFISLLTIGGFVINEPLPEYQTGPEADSLAVAMLDALGYANWQETGAMTFTFAGRHNYLWDKKRNLAIIEWGDHKVWLNLEDRSGQATLNSSPLNGEGLSTALEKAWSMWCNDSFWFCAPFKCFDPGTVRGIVSADDGSRQLLVRYTSGGVTPGDSYLWLLDQQSRPTAWKMWTSIIPVGGVYSSWEKWNRLETGALIAESHSTSSFTLELTNVKGARNLQAMGFSTDPFEPLLRQ